MGKALLLITLFVLFALFFAGCFSTTDGSMETPAHTPVQQDAHVEGEAPVWTVTPSCPESCDDGNPCTADDCGAKTGFQCEYIALSGPEGNCTGNAGNCMEYTCRNGACETQPFSPCCGNGICEEGEGCACTDCACKEGEICCENECKQPKCRVDAQCDDGDKCTKDYCINPGTCKAACVNQLKTCFSFDECCPEGCDFLSDNDCPAQSKGKPANTTSGISVKINRLYTKRCIKSSNGQEEAWLVVSITVQYLNEGRAFFTPAYVTIIDDSNGAILEYAKPVGTDCYESDEGFLLKDGYIYDEEKTGLIYYYYGYRSITQQSKKIVVNTGSGPRLVWLIAPE